MPSLNQKILVLTQGGTNDESAIRNKTKSSLATFKTAVEKATRGQVNLTLYFPEYLNNDLHQNDFYDYGGSDGRIACFSKDFDDILVKNCGIKPYAYDYIMRVYKHPHNKYFSGFYGNTWIWYNEYLGTPHLKKGYSALLINPTPGASFIPPLWEVMVHEYCHQLQHRFNDAGVKTFVNPDRKNELQGNPFFTSSSNMEFYSKIMANLEFPYGGYTSVPYHKLGGVAGVWK